MQDPARQTLEMYCNGERWEAPIIIIYSAPGSFDMIFPTHFTLVFRCLK
jgi:hypothetical protein